jgi:hypothetical protein
LATGVHEDKSTVAKPKQLTSCKCKISFAITGSDDNDKSEVLRQINSDFVLLNQFANTKSVLRTVFNHSFSNQPFHTPVKNAAMLLR